MSQHFEGVLNRLNEIDTDATKNIAHLVQDVEKENIRTGQQQDGSWVDPAYVCIPIPVEDIVPQAVNPNYQSEKSFKALQTSILNNGMAFPVLCARNPLYDPSTEGQPKPRCFSGSQDVVDVRNPELRKYFKYTIVDGTHRLLAVLYGSPMYEDLNNKDSQEIYNRCNGMIPATILEDKTEQELMSAEILFNSARGEHDIMAMKDIVADLARSGLSDQWIARNLFLDPEAITRFKQLSGMKAAFNDEGGYTEDAWDPIKDRVAERRKNINKVQAAARYVRQYRALKGLDSHFDEQVDVVEAAKNLGWDETRPNEIPKSLDDQGKVFEKEISASDDTPMPIEPAEEAEVETEAATESASAPPVKHTPLDTAEASNGSIAAEVVRDFGSEAEQEKPAAAASAMDAILNDDTF